jgi:pimeloyl-ACP methyl ester carboxylesterase
MNPIKEHQFEYFEVGAGKNLLLLHGLFGAMSNWHDVVHHFKDRYRVMIPVLPITNPTLTPPSLEGLTHYVIDFIQHKEMNRFDLVGNSLGGQLAMMLTLKRPDWVKTLTLTGSSGLFEEGMGSGFPRRGDYSYVKERVEFTFYAPQTATKELIDETFETVNNASKALRIIKVAREAQNMNMRQQIQTIDKPTCLVWGLNDNITPTYVAHEFHRLIHGSELHFVDHCSHAPMMEQPVLFNQILSQFLNKHPL